MMGTVQSHILSMACAETTPSENQLSIELIHLAAFEAPLPPMFMLLSSLFCDILADPPYHFNCQWHIHFVRLASGSLFKWDINQCLSDQIGFMCPDITYRTVIAWVTVATTWISLTILMMPFYKCCCYCRFSGRFCLYGNIFQSVSNCPCTVVAVLNF